MEEYNHFKQLELQLFEEDYSNTGIWVRQCFTEHRNPGTEFTNPVDHVQASNVPAEQCYLTTFTSTVQKL